MTARPQPRTLLRYATLAVPLAFAGLPIYVHLPKFYASVQGMDLALLGLILLLVRLFDCVIDPLIGWLGDRYPEKRRRMMVLAAPLMAVAYYALFNPPMLQGMMLAMWLTGGLLLVYLAFSVLMINYYAAGIGLAKTSHDTTRVSAYRETMMLVGVLLASLLPALLAQHYGAGLAYRGLGMLFAAIMAFAAVITLPMAAFTAAPATGERLDFSAFTACLGDAPIRHVLMVFFVNAIPSAITGTLFLFFVADVLRADDAAAGLYLAMYFVAAALAIPFWTFLSKRIGKTRALAVGMGLAVLSFIYAYFLGAGDGFAFGVICVASGAAVGADVALLPALFAEALARKPALSGVGFGIWNFASKLTLALAAGIALPLLALAGYHPGAQGGSITALSLAYAVLPCLVKLIALALLLAHPTARRSSP